MKKIFLIALLILVIFFGYRSFRNDKNRLEENTQLIQTQIRNVGKLIVTEGHYAQVFTYKNSKKFYLDIFSAQKKALIVVNAEVSISPVLCGL